jgi:hypothetical protein
LVMCSAVVSVVSVVSVMSVAGGAVRAGAGGPVGPHQYFAGVINGVDGNTVTPISIQMACFGPLRPGETGHPLGGQTLAVHQLYPPATIGNSLGQTGKDSMIGVFFGAPPPSAGGSTVTFTRYDQAKRLPTSLTLPCSGTGAVEFVPIPVVPPSRSESVPVQYVSQP